MARGLTAILLIFYFTTSILAIRPYRDRHHKKKHQVQGSRILSLGKNERRKASAKRAAAKRIQSEKYNDYYDMELRNELRKELHELEKEELRLLKEEELLNKPEKAAKWMSDDEYLDYLDYYDIMDYKQSDEEFFCCHPGTWFNNWTFKKKKAKTIKDPKKKKVALKEIVDEEAFVKKIKPVKSELTDTGFIDGTGYAKGGSFTIPVAPKPKIELVYAEIKKRRSPSWTKCEDISQLGGHRKYLTKSEVIAKFGFPSAALTHFHDVEDSGKYLVLENMYHSTTKDAAGCIKDYGFKVGKSGAMGAGVYFAFHPEEAKEKAITAGGELKYGDAVVKCDVFMGYAFEPADEKELEGFLLLNKLWDGPPHSRMLNAKPADMRKALNGRGFDSIILEDSTVFYKSLAGGPAACAEMAVYGAGQVKAVKVIPTEGVKASDGQTWDAFCDH
eukprot:423494_1